MYSISILIKQNIPNSCTLICWKHCYITEYFGNLPRLRQQKSSMSVSYHFLNRLQTFGIWPSFSVENELKTIMLCYIFS